MTQEKIRVVIVDDHPGVRAGIKKLLHRAKDIEVVGEGGDGIEAIDLCNARKPDILLLDVELPIVGGDIVMRRVHDVHPDIHVLVVSTYNDRTYVQSMLANGASGYLTKEEAPAMLLNAIHGVLQNNGHWMSPKALETSLPPFLEEQTLTNREVEILRQLVLHRSPSEIAQALQMEEKQVGSFLRVLMNKYETDSLDALEVIAERILPGQIPPGTSYENPPKLLL